MKSIVTNFTYKILLSAILIGSFGSTVQPALVQFSKDLVPVAQANGEKSQLIKQLEERRPEIAALLMQKDECLAIKKEVLRVSPYSPSIMWQRGSDFVQSAWNKTKSFGKGAFDALTIGLISSASAMSAACLTHESLISPSWVPKVNVPVLSAAYTGLMLGALGTCAYHLWQPTSRGIYGAAHDILVNVCQEIGIPLEGISIKSGAGRNKICSKIYDSYNESDSSDTRRGLIKSLISEAHADKADVSNAFAQYRNQINDALKKLKDTVAVKELRDKSFKLAFVLLDIKGRITKIITELNK